MRYPLFLDLSDQPVTVIGAGAVAARKARGLLAAGANLTVISPVATAAIQRLARTRRLRWRRRRYRRGDLRGARLVVAATDDQAINRAVCAEAQRRKLLANCVTPPAAGNFIVPAVIRRGGLTIAISTGGRSPALAKQLRRELEQVIGDDYGRLTQALGALRERLAKTVRAPGKRRDIYRRALTAARRRRA